MDLLTWKQAEQSLTNMLGMQNQKKKPRPVDSRVSEQTS